MTQGDKIFLVIAVAVSAVVAAIFAVVGWLWWAGLLLSGGVFGVWFGVRQRAAVQYVAPPAPQVTYVPPPPPPPPPGSAHIQDVILPSADRDYRFSLHGLVCWRQIVPTLSQQYPQAQQLAVNAIIGRATELTSLESAGDYDLVRNKLNAQLAGALHDRTGQVEAWAQDIALSLPDADLLRLRKLADVRKDEQVWEHERNHERSKRAYLHDDVLKSTGSAVVWWLAQDSTKVEEAVSLIGILAQLSAAARDTEVDPLFLPFIATANSAGASFDSAHLPLFERGDDGGSLPTHLYPGQEAGIVELARKMMDTVLPDSTEPERARLADRLASLMSEMDAHDLAGRIRTAFNAPDFSDVLDSEEPDGPTDSADGPDDVNATATTDGNETPDDRP